MPNSHRNALLTTAATPAPLPWRDRPVVTVDMAADLLGCSRGNIYKRGAAGALDLLRLAGRTVVSVPSIIRLLDSAQRLEPGSRGPRGAALTRARNAIAA